MRRALIAFAAAAFVFPVGAIAAQRENGPVDPIAAQVCANLESKLGADKFAAKFGSADGCKQQVAASAAAIVQQCQSAGKPGTAEFKACVQAAIKAAVQQLVAGGGNDNEKAQQAAAKIAGQVCSNLESKLGADKFASKFGSLEECKSQIASKAGTIAADCAKQGKPGSDPYKACVQDAIKPVVQNLAGGKSKTNPSEAADKIASQLCSSLKEKLGDKFDAKYGSVDECVRKVHGTATSIAAKCKSAGKPGSDEYKACVKDGLQAALKKEGGKGK